MRMRHLAAPLCLAGLISSMTGALAAPAEVLAAVNLRTGPGAQYYTLMTLPPGAPVEIYGCLNDDAWCDVGYGNTRGWISSRYLGTVRNWAPEDQIMRPPVFSPPPIYREPPVYANPPPVYRQPPQDAYPGDIYIEPPPVYVYRPPAGMGPAMPDLPQPNVGVYRVRPQGTLRAAPPPVVTGPPMPELPQPNGTYRAAPQTAPRVASTPPATVRPAPVAPPIATQPTVTQPTAPVTPPVATQPTVPSVTQPPPTVTQPAAPSVATSAPQATPTTPPATEAKPKYGSALGKPGAPCKWVNGVCRND